jgi:hypothetical protein
MALPFPETTPIDFQDGSRWLLRLSNTINATEKPEGNGYNPIPEWFPSVSFTSPFLAIQATTNLTTASKLMGRILQYQGTSLSGGTLTISARKVWRGLQVVRFSQDIEGEYSIRILPKPKISNLTLLIYEYL